MKKIKTYKIILDENYGEYEGGLTVKTHQKVERTGRNSFKIGKTVVEWDEAILGVTEVK